MGTELYRFEVSIGRNANFLKNWGKIGEGVIRFLSQTNYLTFQAPNCCAKFYQNQIKIAVVGVFTYRMTDRRK